MFQNKSSFDLRGSVFLPFSSLFTAVIAQWWILGSTRQFSLILSAAFVVMLLICSIDKSTMSILIRAPTYPQQQQQLIKQEIIELKTPAFNFSTAIPDPVAPNWISVELEKNYTTKLYAHWLEPGGSTCRESKTHEIRIPNFDPELISLATGNPHEISFQAVDENGTSRCLGGDFFEIDLSGENWKSRPPIMDHGNGTYTFTLQVHPDFSGEYNLTIILLFRHFEGLKFSPARFFLDKQLRKIPILFNRPGSTPELSPLPTCTRSDFNRTLWSGRWTRHARNDTCKISNDGRYRCLEAEYPCPDPWCSGPLGSLESNGWVYSAHCGFKLFSRSEAWQCLNNKWLLWWGDSNHVDTVRNLIFFFLGMPDLEVVTRKFDKSFTNPQNRSEKVRITNIFNGHWDDKGNYEGLNSLSNSAYRDLLQSYFNGSGPDTVIFNSGLHDGVKWKNLRRYIVAAEYAAEFWAGLVKGKESRFVFRSTVATGGYARGLAFNPSKIDAYNGVLLDKLMGKGVVDAVVDDFDMTWAWHFDNRCNDGVHYGRFPAKMKWRDGQIGHQYFVDLMLGHVLLNAICAS